MASSLISRVPRSSEISVKSNSDFSTILFSRVTSASRAACSVLSLADTLADRDELENFRLLCEKALATEAQLIKEKIVLTGNLKEFIAV